MAVPPCASTSAAGTSSAHLSNAAASPTSSSPANSALFPPLHTRDVLACQFSAWYPLFKRHSPKATVLRPIPHEADFLDYLESDGLFLPEGSGPMGCVPPLAHSTRRTRADENHRAPAASASSATRTTTTTTKTLQPTRPPPRRPATTTTTSLRGSSPSRTSTPRFAPSSSDTTAQSFPSSTGRRRRCLSFPFALAAARTGRVLTPVPVCARRMPPG